MPPESTAPRQLTLTVAEIARRLGGEVAGDGALAVSGVNSLDEAGPGELSFLANPRFRAKLGKTRAGAVIVAPVDRDATSAARIVTDNPYAYYARVVALFHPPRAAVAGVHPAAVVDPSATVAASAEVAAGAVIGPRARVGERAIIGAGSFVGEAATVGDDTRLHPRVTICDACVVGARCILHPGAVIGADGFGMAPDGEAWVKIPQVGRAVLGDDVEVGANTTIDRGALGDTVIEEGVKLDNQVQVAHNCRIGAHTAIAGCTGIAGSTVIGRHCMIGGAVGFTGHLTVCDGVTVTAMTLITKSLNRPGTYSASLPAMQQADWLRSAAHIRRLDEIARLARGKTAPGDDHGNDDA